MRKISDPKVVAVINDWLGGVDYRTIEARQGVSIAVVSDIITNFCQQHPSIATLRELNLETARTGITVGRAREAISLLDQLKTSGLSVSDVDRCTKFLGRYAPHAKEALEAGILVWNLEHETGQTYGTIVNTAQSAISEKQKALRRKQELQAEIDKYSSMLPDYKELYSLKTKLTNNRITIQELDGFINFHLRLQQMKFDIATAENLATALAGIGLTPQVGSQELARLLLKGRNLLASISALEQSAAEASKNYDQKLREWAQHYTKQTGNMQSELSRLNSVIETEKSLLKEKEQKLTGINEKIAGMERFYETEKERLETEKKKLEEEITAKSNELNFSEKELKNLKTELAGINSVIEGKEPLLLIASILEGSKQPIEKKDLLQITQQFAESLKPRYAYYRPEYRRSMINEALEALIKNTTEELAFEQSIRAS